MVVALRLRDLGVGEVFRLLPGLRGLGRLDHGIAVGLGLGDLGIPLYLGDPRLAERVEVALRVADVPDGETDDSQPHVGHVTGGNLLHLGGKGVAVLVDLLDGHGAENGAEMPLERLHRDVLDVVRALAEELLRGGRDRNVVAFDLDLRDAVNFHRHALARVDLRRLHVDGHQFQLEDVHLLEDRPDEDATALDDAEAHVTRGAVGVDHVPLSARDDEDLVGSHLRVAAGPDAGEDENDEQDRANGADQAEPRQDAVGKQDWKAHG